MTNIPCNLCETVPSKLWSFCSMWRSDGRKPRRWLWPSVTTVGNFCAGRTMAGPGTTGDGGRFWQWWQGRSSARMACCFGKTSANFFPVGKLSTGKAHLLLTITHVDHCPLLTSQIVFWIVGNFYERKVVLEVANLYDKFLTISDSTDAKL